MQSKIPEEKIEELIQTLDHFFADGGGHINISYKKNASDKTMTSTYNECTEGKNACGVPTELDTDTP